MSEKEMTIKKKLLADIDWNCAIPSLVIVALIALPAILFEEQTSTFVNNFFNTFVEATSAFYIVIPVFLIGIGLWMAFSKYGKVVLGDPKERPAISNFTYIATRPSCALAPFNGHTSRRTLHLALSPILMRPFWQAPPILFFSGDFSWPLSM